jgi:UDP-N-acetylmuramoyl-tripeptide--D-alanyl-D-alanine ligase
MKTEELYSVFLSHPEVTTDTRQVVPGSVFYALKGDRFNGNEFALKALEAGCAYAVVDDDRVNGTGIIHVDNVLASLQNLASHHRSRCKAKILAVTGTNGKTTTKELIASVLSSSRKIIYTQGNLNNHIGVPLTLLNIRTDTDIAVVEMGANHPGEIDMLCRIADPDIGIITNVGIAHIEGFGSFETIVNTKTELYRYLHQRGRPALVNAANPMLMKHSDEALDKYYAAGKNALVTGHLAGNDVSISVVWNDIAGREYRVSTQLTGGYNLENVLAAIAAGKFFCISDEMINLSIENYSPSNKRSQFCKTERNEVLIDSYNANPTSMKVAVENIYRLKKENKVLILGDMFELGAISGQEHKLLLTRIKEMDFSRVLLAGTNFFEFRNDFPFMFFEKTEDLAGYLKENPLSGTFVLLKGSRGMRMEQVLDWL